MPGAIFVAAGRKNELRRLLQYVPGLNLLCEEEDPITLELLQPSDLVAVFRSRDTQHKYYCFHAGKLAEAFQAGQRFIPQTREPISAADANRLVNMMRPALGEGIASPVHDDARRRRRYALSSANSPRAPQFPYL